MILSSKICIRVFSGKNVKIFKQKLSQKVHLHIRTQSFRLKILDWIICFTLAESRINTPQTIKNERWQIKKDGCKRIIFCLCILFNIFSLKQTRPVLCVEGRKRFRDCYVDIREKFSGYVEGRKAPFKILYPRRTFTWREGKCFIKYQIHVKRFTYFRARYVDVMPTDRVTLDTSVLLEEAHCVYARHHFANSILPLWRLLMPFYYYNQREKETRLEMQAQQEKVIGCWVQK